MILQCNMHLVYSPQSRYLVYTAYPGRLQYLMSRISNVFYMYRDVTRMLAQRAFVLICKVYRGGLQGLMSRGIAACCLYRDVTRILGQKAH
jgi:hypothetical protein